jgi:hypothetical protein
LTIERQHIDHSKRVVLPYLAKFPHFGEILDLSREFFKSFGKNRIWGYFFGLKPIFLTVDSNDSNVLDLRNGTNQILKFGRRNLK